MSKKEQLFKRMVKLPSDGTPTPRIKYFAGKYENDICKFVDWCGNTTTTKWSDDIVAATPEEIAIAVESACKNISAMMGLEY